jgi:pyridoxal biosynthesis lyase PdxS
LSRPWTCLVVVSPDRTPNTLRLARSLAELGNQQRRGLVEMIDASDELDLDRATAIAHNVELDQGERRFVVALDSPVVNPVAIGVLTAADAALMLLEKGVSQIPQARRIIEIAGRERFIGAVVAAD